MTLRILWAALFASTLIYVVILVVVGAQPGMVPDPTAGLALAVAAPITAVVSFVLPRHFHRLGLSNTKLEIEDAPDPNASVMGFGERGPKIRVFSDPSAARNRAIALFFTPFILSLALTEAISIFGLLVGEMGFSWSWVLPFFVLSWILFLARFPTAARIFAPLEKALGAKIADRAP